MHSIRGCGSWWSSPQAVCGPERAAAPIPLLLAFLSRSLSLLLCIVDYRNNILRACRLALRVAGALRAFCITETRHLGVALTVTHASTGIVCLLVFPEIDDCFIATLRNASAWIQTAPIRLNRTVGLRSSGRHSVKCFVSCCGVCSRAADL